MNEHIPYAPYISHHEISPIIARPGHGMLPPAGGPG